MKKNILFLLISFAFISCIPKKEIIYLQSDDNLLVELSKDYEPTLKPDDLLQILVKTLDKESSEPYSLNNQNGTISPVGNTGYLIDKEGFIDFPFIGKIKAAGLKKSEFKAKISDELSKHLKNAFIDVRFINFRVNVIGEVSHPGTIDVSSEKITILEALSKAGDLTIYGNRKNIKLIREENGVVITHTLDLTSSKIISSPFYYLDQNDVIYVEPRRTKADSTAIGGNVTTGISVISSLLTLVLILTTL